VGHYAYTPVGDLLRRSNGGPGTNQKSPELLDSTMISEFLA